MATQFRQISTRIALISVLCKKSRNFSCEWQSFRGLRIPVCYRNFLGSKGHCYGNQNQVKLHIFQFCARYGSNFSGSKWIDRFSLQQVVYKFVIYKFVLFSGVIFSQSKLFVVSQKSTHTLSCVYLFLCFSLQTITLVIYFILLSVFTLSQLLFLVLFVHCFFQFYSDPITLLRSVVTLFILLLFIFVSYSCLSAASTSQTFTFQPYLTACLESYTHAHRTHF